MKYNNHYEKQGSKMIASDDLDYDLDFDWIDDDNDDADDDNDDADDDEEDLPIQKDNEEEDDGN